jgi:ADP-heptose:LPS heptosyltransferase
MRETSNDKREMNVLIFFASGLGDALFVAPAYFAIRDLYPSARITAMVPYLRFNKYLLQNILGFDDVIPLKRLRSFSPLAAASYLKYFYKLSKDIRKRHFDMVFLTVDTCLPDQYLLTLMSGAKHRIGPKFWRRKKNKFRFVLTTQVETPFNGHIIDFHFDLILSLNKNLEIQKYLRKTTSTLIESAEPSNFTPITNKLLIVLPGSGTQSHKRWPFENFIEVISKVLNDYNCDIVTLGGADEYDSTLIPPKITNNPKFHNLSDTLSLPQIIHLLLQANLIIGNDNGILHLAEFLNKPTIGIYPGNWTHVSKRFFDNDRKHIVLPRNKEDTLAEKLMNRLGRTKKIQNICIDVVNSISSHDVITEINNTALLKQPASAI